MSSYHNSYHYYVSLIKFFLLELSTNVICGQVVEIADRDGYKGILVDDSSGLIVLKDYKEDREPLQIGDFIKAFGGMRKPSKFIL